MQEQAHATGIGAGASSDAGQQRLTQDAPSTSPGPERDAEAEQELTEAARSDPFAAYDVEVALEGQAIREYLAMLRDSGAAGGQAGGRHMLPQSSKSKFDAPGSDQYAQLTCSL